MLSTTQQHFGASVDFFFSWGVAYFGLVIFSFFIATPEHWATLVLEGRIKAEYAVYIGEIPAWVVGITLVAAITRLLGGVALLVLSGFAVWYAYVNTNNGTPT